MQLRAEVARRSAVKKSIENLSVNVIQFAAQSLIGQPDIGVLTDDSQVIVRQPHAIAGGARVEHVLSSLATLSRNEARAVVTRITLAGHREHSVGENLSSF